MPTPSRLLFIAPNPGFVRLFLRDSIRMLLAEGHELTVVCAPETGPQRLAFELGCPVHTLRMARSIALWNDLRCLCELILLMGRLQPQMVHTHTPKAGLLGSLAAFIRRVPVRIHTIHGLRSETLTGLRRRIVVSMERLTTRVSTHCLAVSGSLREEVIRAGICPAAKLRVLGAGSCAGIALKQFDPELCREQAQAIRAAHGVLPRQVLITYIGRLAEDKGLSVLEAAWRMLRTRFPEVRLLIAGPHDASDPCEAAMIERLRDDRRVTLLEGFLTNPAPWMAASDLFVQPSFREGLGVAALEASAMQVPVVASQVTGLVDAVEDERTGLLVKPYNAAALARALGVLIRDPYRRQAMGEQGRRFVEQRFSREVVMARLKLFYSTLPERTEHATVPPRAATPCKRAFDCIAAALLLVFASPVLLLCCLAILLLMGRPVLFRQDRAGLNGTVFSLVKLRTMRAPRPGEAALGTDTARTTWLGGWLRRLSLDELPQLCNVLRGEMSLVGPRPLLAEYLPRYNAIERRRHEVRPGITGWAQIHGRNNAAWHDRFTHDVWYVDHRTFALDLRILFQTALRLVRPEGIVPAGRGAMQEFLGSSAARPQL